ncbi:MAG: pre-peptidase C-terminal domain-containing protein [Rubripirellula sp.]
MRFALPILLILACSNVQAGISVFLDYTDFETQLNTATSFAGTAVFNATEVSTIRGNILSSLNFAFSDFDVTFSEVNPGGTFETLTFGAADPSSFGRADGIDWRNDGKTDVAEVYTANFDGFIETFEPRTRQIAELSASLAGTAAHELGHNLGLRHQDSYGAVTYTGTAINTGGVQNLHIMATGATALSEPERETQRTFSDHSKVKLSYADGLLNFTPASVNEVGDAGDTIATAMALNFTDLAVVDRRAVNVVASHSSSADTDFFSVVLEAGSTLTVDINNELFGSNPFLRVFDAASTLLASNDDTQYSGDSFGSGDVRADDSILFNVPVATSGTYFIEVDNLNNGGTYDLLLHTDVIAVPEPMMAGMLVLGTLAFCRRQRG